jgi:hypothetical protein
MADWQTMETAPRFIRPDNTNYGPLFWGLIPYSPLNQPDVCWWNDRAKCFEHTGQDGLNDIQPVMWQPLPVPAIPETHYDEQ